MHRKKTLREIPFKGEPSLRFVKEGTNSAVIRDPFEDAATNTDNATSYSASDTIAEEFQTFKLHMSAEMSNLKQVIDQQSTVLQCQQSIGNLPQQQPDANSMLLNCLMDRIKFLENSVASLMESQSKLLTIFAQQALAATQTTAAPDAYQTILPTVTRQTVQHASIPATAQQPIPVASAIPECQSTSPPRGHQQPSRQTPKSPTRNNQNQHNDGDQTGYSKKQVYIIGDSMLNNIDEKNMRQHHFVRVRNHPGATSEDLVHHVRPHLRKQPDAMILLVGHNDISENCNKRKEDPINSVESVRQIIRETRESNPECQIALCQLTPRTDIKGIMKDVNNLNRQYALLAQREAIVLVKMDKFTVNDLGRGGLHPTDRTGKPAIANILKQFVRNL